MLEIPVFPTVSSDFSLSVLLEKVRCNMRIMWNTKTQHWMINTYEEPDTGKLVHGLKMLPDYPFLFTYAPSFPGQLICLKIGADTDADITYTNFGNGWGLFYLTEEEFDEWRVLSGF